MDTENFLRASISSLGIAWMDQKSAVNCMAIQLEPWRCLIWAVTPNRRQQCSDPPTQHPKSLAKSTAVRAFLLVCPWDWLCYWLQFPCASIGVSRAHSREETIGNPLVLFDEREAWVVEQNKTYTLASE